MISTLSVLLFATCCCVFVTSKSVNVTTRCDEAGDCSVIEFYAKFVDNVLELNGEYVTEECKNALDKYRSGLKNFGTDALRSKK